MRRWRFGILGGLVVGVVILLAGALQGTEFRGGRPFPSPGVGALSGSPTRGVEISASWILDLLRIVVFLGLCLSAILVLFSRHFRRHVLYLLLSLAVFGLAWSMISRWVGSVPVQAPAEAPPGAVWGGEEGGAEEMVPTAPSWAVPLATVVAACLLALWLGPRLLGMLEQKRRRKGIQEVAREAMAELQRGGPVSDVVLRAWLRMVEILSARAGAADRPSLTPREFAENLAKLGFRDEAIQLLTELFEEVRYGHKESEPRRAQALAALAALEQAYA